MGVGVCWRGKQLADRPLFHDLACVHHRYPLSHFGYHSQVMGNHHQGHALGFLQADQEVHNLRLNRHVQRCRGLIGDQQLGVTGYGNSNHHTLAHAARKLVRIVVHAAFGTGNFYHLQQFNRAGLGRCTAQAEVRFKHLYQLVAHGKARVQRCHRVLKNHGHVFAQDTATLRIGNAQQVLPIKLQRVRSNTALPC